MQPYTVVLTQRKQYSTISFGAADLVATPTTTIWAVNDMATDQKVKAKLFKAVREHFLGGTATQMQGAMYAAPMHDVAQLVRTVLGEDNVTRDQRLAEERAAQALVAKHNFWFAIGTGIGCIIQCVVWVFIAAIKISLWMVLFPFLLGALKHGSKRH